MKGQNQNIDTTLKQQVKISYYVADTKGQRRHVVPDDARGEYSSFEEAMKHYHYDGDGDTAILAYIQGEWYRAGKVNGTVKYKHIDRLWGDWHTLEEIIDGIDISKLPFHHMLAMAAATAYCNGTLATEIGVSQKALHEYGFYDKFTEYFGSPMYEFKV